MSESTLNEQLSKALARQGTIIFNHARDALSKRDFMALAEQARALQVSAQSAGATLIDAQAKLLEQAAQRQQAQQATKILTTIKDAILSLRHGESDRHPTPAPRATVPPSPTPAPKLPTTFKRDESYLKRLGNYLVEAELVTPAQIEVALADQRATGSRLGDILVARGWVKPGTIEFIMEKVVVPERSHQHPLVEAAPFKKTSTPSNMNMDRATLIDQNLPNFVEMEDFRK